MNNFTRNNVGAMLSETPLQRSFINCTLNIKPFTASDRLRPYMPALVLLAIDNATRGNNRWMNYSFCETALKRMMKDGLGVSAMDPKYPFWYLQSAGDCWTVEADIPLGNLKRRRGKAGEPLISELRLHNARGALKAVYHDELSRNPVFAAHAKEILYDRYIPRYSRNRMADVITTLF